MTFDKVDPTTIERYYRDYYTNTIGSGASCWADPATQDFLANVNNGHHYPNSGANNSDSTAIVHALPIIARYAPSGDAYLFDAVTVAVLVVQNEERYAVGQAITAAVLLQQ